MKQEKPEMDDFKEEEKRKNPSKTFNILKIFWKMSKILTDTRQKCHKIFLYIFSFWEKNMHFLEAGGGVDPHSIASASTNNAK